MERQRRRRADAFKGKKGGGKHTVLVREKCGEEMWGGRNGGQKGERGVKVEENAKGAPWTLRGGDYSREKGKTDEWGWGSKREGGGRGKTGKA